MTAPHIYDAMEELRRYGFLSELTLTMLTHEERQFVINQVEREERESE